MEYGVKKDSQGFTEIVVTWDIEPGQELLTNYSIGNIGHGLVTPAVKRKREQKQFLPIPDNANSQREYIICKYI